MSAIALSQMLLARLIIRANERPPEAAANAPGPVAPKHVTAVGASHPSGPGLPWPTR